MNSARPQYVSGAFGEGELARPALDLAHEERPVDHERDPLARRGPDADRRPTPAAVSSRADPSTRSARNIRPATVNTARRIAWSVAYDVTPDGTLSRARSRRARSACR